MVFAFFSSASRPGFQKLLGPRLGFVCTGWQASMHARRLRLMGARERPVAECLCCFHATWVRCFRQCLGPVFAGARCLAERLGSLCCRTLRRTFDRCGLDVLLESLHCWTTSALSHNIVFCRLGVSTSCIVGGEGWLFFNIVGMSFAYPPPASPTSRPAPSSTLSCLVARVALVFTSSSTSCWK